MKTGTRDIQDNGTWLITSSNLWTGTYCTILSENIRYKK